MKILFFLVIIFNLSSIHLSYAFNTDNISQELDKTALLIKQNKDDPDALFRIKNQLINKVYKLESCLAKENEYLQDQTKEFELLKNINYEPAGIELQHKNKQIIKQHQDKLYLCQYHLLKITKLSYQIEIYNQHLFLKNLFQHNDSFSKIMVYTPELNWDNAQIVFSEIKNSRNIKRYFVIFFSMLGLLGAHFFFKKFKHLNIFLNFIDPKKLLHTIGLYSISAPVFFLVIYIIFFQKNDILKSFYARPITYISVYVYIVGFYQLIKVRSYKKDILIILPIFLCTIFMLFTSMALLYLKSLANTTLQIIALKYWILISLQPIQISVLYWCFVRIMKLKLHQNVIIGSIVTLVAVFFVGLYGYINLAAYINFLIIINFLYFGCMIIYTKIFKNILNAFKNHQSKPYRFILKRFHTLTNMAITNIKLLVSVLYILFILYVGLAIFMTTIPFITEIQLTKIYDLIYNPKLFMTINYSINQIVAGFLLFNFFNLINYLISLNLARKFYQDKDSQHKTTKFFISVGYVLNLVLISLILNIHVENIGIISGTIFLGLGIALQSSLSRIFSSFLLYINPPFRIGDYIEIQNTKGYVKKISFLETFIETSDNNTIILPNQIISTSTIENYNFENKSFQKIHVNYILNNLDIQKEEHVKIKLREILTANKNIFEDKRHPIAFIFSLFTQTADTHHLEIIFCYHTQINMKQELTQLNREIANTLKSFKIDAKFESMHFPYD